MTISQFKKKVWTIFSKYIRLRDSEDGFGRCITCKKRVSVKEAHAGHWRHGNTKATYFFEKNVHLQCKSCNFYKDGARDVYAVALEKKYGYGILQEIDKLDDPKFVWTMEKLKKVKVKYEEKLDTLRELR